jgi:hypothetical protein
MDLGRRGEVIEEQRLLLGGLRALLLRKVVADYLLAELNALIADEHAGTGDEFADHVLRLATETAPHLIEPGVILRVEAVKAIATAATVGATAAEAKIAILFNHLPYSLLCRSI